MCGAGTLLIEAAQEWPGACYAGMDVSDEQLGLCLGNLQQSHTQSRIAVCRGRVEGAIYLFVCLFIYLFIYLFMYVFIYLLCFMCSVAAPGRVGRRRGVRSALRAQVSGGRRRGPRAPLPRVRSRSAPRLEPAWPVPCALADPLLA
jgi:hypothetical protein